jgi:hypothetical protein
MYPKGNTTQTNPLQQIAQIEQLKRNMGYGAGTGNTLQQLGAGMPYTPPYEGAGQ